MITLLETIVLITTNLANQIVIDQEIVGLTTKPINQTAIDLETVALIATKPINQTAIDLGIVDLTATNQIHLGVTTVTNQLVEIIQNLPQEEIILEEDEKSIYQVLLKCNSC
jgi:hypothetical protein